jgi:hypothetical protein
MQVKIKEVIDSVKQFNINRDMKDALRIKLVSNA